MRIERCWGRLCIFSGPLGNGLEICWLTEASRSVGILLDVFTAELSCGTEVRAPLFKLLHEPGFDAVDSNIVISWIEDLFVINIEEGVYSVAVVGALFDMQNLSGQGL